MNKKEYVNLFVKDNKNNRYFKIIKEYSSDNGKTFYLLDNLNVISELTIGNNLEYTIDKNYKDTNNTYFYNNLNLMATEYIVMLLQKQNNINTLPDNLENKYPKLYGILSIPNTIITIGYNNFKNQNISKVIIPNSVKIIKKGAFTFCNYLETIIISDSVTDLHYNVFWRGGLCNIPKYISNPLCKIFLKYKEKYTYSTSINTRYFNTRYFNNIKDSITNWRDPFDENIYYEICKIAKNKFDIFQNIPIEELQITKRIKNGIDSFLLEIDVVNNYPTINIYLKINNNLYSYNLNKLEINKTNNIKNCNPIKILTEFNVISDNLFVFDQDPKLFKNNKTTVKYVIYKISKIFGEELYLESLVNLKNKFINISIDQNSILEKEGICENVILEMKTYDWIKENIQKNALFEYFNINSNINSIIN